jgi:hypothetical protein
MGRRRRRLQRHPAHDRARPHSTGHASRGPHADDLDIASAQADLAFHTRRLPDSRPHCSSSSPRRGAGRAHRGRRRPQDRHRARHRTARGDAERADLAAGRTARAAPGAAPQ